MANPEADAARRAVERDQFDPDFARRVVRAGDPIKDLTRIQSVRLADVVPDPKAPERLLRELDESLRAERKRHVEQCQASVEAAILVLKRAREELGGAVVALRRTQEGS